MSENINTSAVRGSNYSGYTTETDGAPLTESVKHKPNLGVTRTVGASVGLTINLGNFESYRIDCWATDEIRNGESAREAIQRVQKVLDNHVLDVRKQVKGK